MQKASFDNYAKDYDAHFTYSKIGEIQRKIVYAKLRPLLTKQQHVVEINCGTGYDALVLAKKVESYLATDVSEQMIKIGLEKLNNGKETNLQFKQCSIQELETELIVCNFLFSNFGGLNCLSPTELKAFTKKCIEKMPAGAEIFFVIMGKKCVWERIYFLMKGQYKQVFRRLSTEGVSTKINKQEFTTWYYSPKEIKTVFSPSFEFINTSATAFFVPPSYLNPFFEKKNRWLNLLARLDKIFTTFKWTANYGDHYFIHLKKRL